MARYVIALGSNRRGRHGAPACEVAAALEAIGDVVASSRVIASAAVGPSARRFANAVVVIESDEAPPALLARLKGLERAWGRRAGRQWGARVLDLDVILWSHGAWASPGLVIPHPLFRKRDFVLAPLAAVAPGWRDPLSGLTVRQLHRRLTRRRAVNRRGNRWRVRSSVGRASDF